ncbi:MFS general substrate transporter [Aspergillus homomorphus CBS 101889]|uniref:MFS general substrate transporter n=1 Tax=Aspergillus homomorphus (strain CBS 101889) TaxID=1450537 RepID=A0A395HXV8_ASPHC|nr:MFS general substrate transporter [Aspergillus homomorphus CBS 101889]RAL12620.1 MFS general substrate transporter [Aspergillus homomorphus CBS 101889]
MVIPTSFEWQWRILMILQLLPSTILLIGYSFCPESPRFFMMRGQVTAARESLISPRGGLDESDPYFAQEYTELRNKVDQSDDTATHGPWQAMKRSCRRLAEDKTFRRVLILVMFVQIFFIMSGGNSITYYAPTVLESIGFNAEKVLLFTAVYGTINIHSVFLYAFLLTERFGRRPLLLTGSHPTAAAIIAVIALYVFAIGYGFGWAPAFSLTASEICSTSMRDTAITITFTYQNLLYFGITRGFPNTTVAMHSRGPFALFTACTFWGTTWVFFAVPECKGRRSMERTDALMALPWYKAGFDPVPPPQPLSDASTEDVEKNAYSEHEETVEVGRL